MYTYNYKPIYFISKENSKIKSVIPFMFISSVLTGKRIVSLPFTDFCDPIFNSSNDLELTKEFILEYSKNNKFEYVEFRSSDTKFPFNTENYRTDLRHILNLSISNSELFKLFSQNTKRNIKKASKENLSVSIVNSLDGIELFYRIFCLTRKRHGLPPQPFSFFRNIFKYIIKDEYGDIFLAEHDGKVIAGAIYFKFGEKIIYKFGASILDGTNPGINHLVMWEAIKYYNAKGFKEFDFGRTEINHEGLRRFKLGFGTEERMIFTTRFNIDTNKFISADLKTEGFYNKIFNTMPVWILKSIGNMLYKHIG